MWYWGRPGKGAAVRSGWKRCLPLPSTFIIGPHWYMLLVTYSFILYPMYWVLFNAVDSFWSAVPLVARYPHCSHLSPPLCVC